MANMTVDELVAAQQEIKSKINDLHDQARANKVLLDAKILEQHKDEAKKQLKAWGDKNGKTLEEAAEYWQGRYTFDDGTSPDPGRWIQANLVLGKPGKAV